MQAIPPEWDAPQLFRERNLALNAFQLVSGLVKVKAAQQHVQALLDAGAPPPGSCTAVAVHVPEKACDQMLSSVCTAGPTKAACVANQAIDGSDALAVGQASPMYRRRLRRAGNDVWRTPTQAARCWCSRTTTRSSTPSTRSWSRAAPAESFESMAGSMR